LVTGKGFQKRFFFYFPPKKKGGVKTSAAVVLYDQHPSPRTTSFGGGLINVVDGETGEYYHLSLGDAKTPTGCCYLILREDGIVLFVGEH